MDVLWIVVLCVLCGGAAAAVWGLERLARAGGGRPQ
jgi:hypothetical protein